MTKARECQLNAEGYRVVFDIQSLDREGYVHYGLRFLLGPELGTVTLQSTADSIALSDLERFLVYLEEHITHLAHDSSLESHTFVEWELGFQAQALCGEARTESDGEFTLRFLVNVGSAKDVDEDGTHVYVGAEGPITLSEVRSFIANTHAALAELR